MPADFHEVSFQKNPVNKMFRGKCTCGWSGYGFSLTELQGTAAAHAVGWEPVPVEQAEPASAVRS